VENVKVTGVNEMLMQVHVIVMRWLLWNCYVRTENSTCM